MKWYGWTILALTIVAMSLIGVIIYMSQPNGEEPQVIERVDTVICFKRDTIRVTDWEIKERIKEVKVLDTIVIHDTILMRVQREYDDSIAHILYSGIDPTIDSITYTLSVKEIIIEKEKEIKVTEKKKTAWTITIGPQLGIGAGYDMIGRQIGAGPYIGFGATIGWGVVLK